MQRARDAHGAPLSMWLSCKVRSSEKIRKAAARRGKKVRKCLAAARRAAKLWAPPMARGCAQLVAARWLLLGCFASPSWWLPLLCTAARPTAYVGRCGRQVLTTELALNVSAGGNGAATAVRAALLLADRALRPQYRPELSMPPSCCRNRRCLDQRQQLGRSQEPPLRGPARFTRQYSRERAVHFGISTRKSGRTRFSTRKRGPHVGRAESLWRRRVIEVHECTIGLRCKGAVRASWLPAPA